MSYEQAVSAMLALDGVVDSTMMKTPCLRYKGSFLAMMFDKEDALIIKVSPERVNELVSQGFGVEFNLTKKRFKEWVLIPLKYQDDYEAYISEALTHAQENMSK
ncbi:hypothetical protein [Ruegeria sp. EL01]|jgi:hypothetical protein|uniref:hypothetical protein n=1 Tax=Ruegeria sp. EL01 TaxID=2107578 RepID=UPI000EA7F448|nr:hypothetical protein [Ruegeria sp. EL01]